MVAILPVGLRQAIPFSPRRLNGNQRRNIQGWLLTSPALLLVFVFYVAPLVLLVVMSFYNWPLLGEIRPIGLRNYSELFGDGEFLAALIFTCTFTAVLVPLSMAVSYATAVIVRQPRRGVGFFRTSYFLPVTIGFTAAAYMTSVLLSSNNGIVNTLLKNAHLTDGTTNYFAQTGSAFWVVVVLTIWKTMGVAMILIMAGMQSIPEEIFEAAKIDGAGWWRRELSITVPLIKRFLALTLILATAGTLLTFDQFYVLTKGGPAGSTITAVLYNYAQSFMRYKLGYGATISIALSVIILSLTLLQLRVFRDREAGR